MLADVFESFKNKLIEIYEHDPSHFLSAPGLAWQACLKKTEEELELLADIDMLLMLKKASEAEYVMQYIDMSEKIINIWRNMIKISNHHTSCIYMQTTDMDGQCLKSFL